MPSYVTVLHAPLYQHDDLMKVPTSRFPFPSVPLPFPQHIPKLLQRASVQLGLLPQIGCQEPVCVPHGDKRGLERIFQRLGRSRRGGVDILHPGQLQESLDRGRSDQTCAAGCRDQLPSMVSIRDRKKGNGVPNSPGQSHSHTSHSPSSANYADPPNWYPSTHDESAAHSTSQ